MGNIKVTVNHIDSVKFPYAGKADGINIQTASCALQFYMGGSPINIHRHKNSRVHKFVSLLVMY